MRIPSGVGSALSSWGVRRAVPARPLPNLKSEAQGAATQVWAAVHPDAGRHSGEYLSDCNVARSTRQGRDLALAEKLWAKTEEIVAGLP